MDQVELVERLRNSVAAMSALAALPDAQFRKLYFAERAGADRTERVNLMIARGYRHIERSSK